MRPLVGEEGVDVDGGGSHPLLHPPLLAGSHWVYLQMITFRQSSLHPITSCPAIPKQPSLVAAAAANAPLILGFARSKFPSFRRRLGGREIRRDFLSIETKRSLNPPLPPFIDELYAEVSVWERELAAFGNNINRGQSNIGQM